MNEEISWRRRGTMLLAALCVLAGLCLLCPSLLEAAQAKEQLVLYLDDGDIVFTGNDRVEQEGQGGDSTYRKDIVITQRDPSVPTAHTITVRGETVISSSFILKDVNIDTSGAATPRPAINIEKREDKSLARAIELTLAPGSQNTLKSGGGCAALQVGGQNQGNRYDPSMLTIKSASDNPGRLTATALGTGAGIGTGAGSAASDSAAVMYTKDTSGRRSLWTRTPRNLWCRRLSTTKTQKGTGAQSTAIVHPQRATRSRPRNRPCQSVPKE